MISVNKIIGQRIDFFLQTEYFILIYLVLAEYLNKFHVIIVFDFGFEQVLLVLLNNSGDILISPYFLILDFGDDGFKLLIDIFCDILGKHLKLLNFVLEIILEDVIVLLN